MARAPFRISPPRTHEQVGLNGIPGLPVPGLSSSRLAGGAGRPCARKFLDGKIRSRRQPPWEPRTENSVLSVRVVESAMYNVFYVIGVIVVVLAILSLVGLA